MDPTVRKLLRENFSGSSPLLLDEEQAEALGQRLQEQLAGQDLVRVKPRNPHAKQDKMVIREIQILGGSDWHHWHHNHFDLWLDKDNGLNFGDRQHTVAVSGEREIVDFVLACRDRMLQRKAQQSKRDKVHKLKDQAVVARVKQLAREELFDFYTEKGHRALKLFIKLSERECVELQVPYKDFEGVIPHLRGAIQSLRALHGRGLRFGVRQISGPSAPWVRHDTL